MKQKLIMENWRNFLIYESLEQRIYSPFPANILEEGLDEIGLLFALGGNVAADYEGTKQVYDGIMGAAQTQMDGDRQSAENQISNAEWLKGAYSDYKAAMSDSGGDVKAAAQTLDSMGYTVKVGNYDSDDGLEIAIDAKADMPFWGSSAGTINNLGLDTFNDLEIQQDTGDAGDTGVPGTYSSSRVNHSVLINMMDNAATPEAKRDAAKKLLDYDREMGENSPVPDNAVERAKFTLGID